MCAAALRLRALLGRRGTWLLLWGCGWICWGYGTVAEPQTDQRGLRLLIAIAPLHCWAWVWIGTGIITLAFSVLRTPRDWPGFIVALIPPLAWSVSYFAAGITGALDRGPWAGTLWLIIAGAVLKSSLTREHSVPHPRKTGATWEA
ncbi:hypothetical protein [Streptomyces turgidiscabies]|uniref:hypothetical protein n=1 Tax=Streptomyces turgidiscabies TaxID=85558 RepID=UPI0038F70405